MLAWPVKTRPRRPSGGGPGQRAPSARLTGAVLAAGGEAGDGGSDGGCAGFADGGYLVLESLSAKGMEGSSERVRWRLEAEG